MIIGLDTSTPRISLAVREAGRTLVKLNHISPKRHNETLLILVDKLLTQARKAPRDIKGIAVGTGPGSFTGVRLGIAAAIGMAQALAIPVTGLSSYLTMAVGSGHPLALVLGDAHQGMLYAACYRQGQQGWEPVFPETLMSLSKVAAALPLNCGGIVTGPEASQYHTVLKKTRPDWELMPGEQQLPEAEMTIQIADGTIPTNLEKTLPKGGMPVREISPIYLRRTQAEEVRTRLQNAPESGS
jgi:tRNA threonylcarbamoyladenosine biosynthesis protein TsaB